MDNWPHTGHIAHSIFLLYSKTKNKKQARNIFEKTAQPY